MQISSNMHMIILGHSLVHSCYSSLQFLLSEVSEIFASNGFSLSSVGGLYLTFCFEEFGALSPLDSVVWILSVLKSPFTVARVKKKTK